MKLKISIMAVLQAILLLFATVVYAENIDPNEDGSQYAYGENVGWVNLEPNLAEPNVGATVSDEKLTGFIWAENIGWVNLSPASYGGVFNNDGWLYGYAWGENVGWINFEPMVAGDSNHYGVTVDGDGVFDGWAWGESIGWVHFKVALISVPVDDLLSTSVGRVGYERRTGQFSVNVTVTNTSETAIGNPVWLVFESISSPSVTVANVDGMTSDGKEYIDLSVLLGDGQLEPGEVIMTRIYFNNPSRVLFTFDASVRGMILP